MAIIDDLKKDYVFVENEYLRLRKLSTDDSVPFLRVLKAVSPIPGIYELDGFNDLMWQETVSSDTTLTLAIEWKKENAEPDTHIYIGECMIKNPVSDSLELGLDIAPEYQNRGLGTGAMRLLITALRSRCPDLKLVAKIYSDNAKSRHICLKLGGVKTGEEPGEYAEAVAIASTLSEKEAGTGTEEHSGKAAGTRNVVESGKADVTEQIGHSEKEAGTGTEEHPEKEAGTGTEEHSGKAVMTGISEKKHPGKDGGAALADPATDMIVDRHIDIFEFRE